jgi:uncharacterized membrane protein YbhN (UPF0104 family)
MPNPTILAARTIAVSFAKQIIIPAVIVGYGAILLIFIVLYWLANQLSPWWWVFAVPVSFVAIVFGLIVAVSAFLIKRISPPTTKYQRKLAKRFVEEVVNYSDLVGASRFFIAYKVIKDVIRKKPKTYLSEMTQKPGDLKRIFAQLRDSF